MCLCMRILIDALVYVWKIHQTPDQTPLIISQFSIKVLLLLLIFYIGQMAKCAWVKAYCVCVCLCVCVSLCVQIFALFMHFSKQIDSIDAILLEDGFYNGMPSLYCNNIFFDTTTYKLNTICSHINLPDINNTK